jgi:hypothetical protein
MKRNTFEEIVTLDSPMLSDELTGLRQLSDGYVVCKPRIARTGIQLYRGVEVGRPDLKEVRVYRPPEEVFSHDAVKALAGKPVTLEHPDHMVTAETWRDDAVGYLGTEILRDGEFIRVPLHLMDAKAVSEVKSGKTQLSVGYTAVLQWKDGKTPSGEPYDAVQTAIRANHVAITHTARGGPSLRMGDRKPKEKTMGTRTILVDNISVELEDRDAQIVERRINALEKQIADANTALATAKTTAQNDIATAKTETTNATATVATKDAEIATLKQQLTEAKMSPEKLDKMVAERVNTVNRAKAIIGDALVVIGKTDADMRKQVVLAKLGDTAKDWNDDMITASFNTLSVADTTSSDNGNGLQHVVQVLSHNDSGGVDQRAKAYAQYNDDLSNRWKTGGQQRAS